MRKKELTILFVEDDDAIVDVYTQAFKAKGFYLKVIKWGKEAIEKVKEIDAGREKKPDLFLIDLILPDINGIEIAKEIKKSPNLQNIPLFILTNYTHPTLIEESGIKPDRFIVKANITPSKLIDILKKELNF